MNFKEDGLVLPTLFLLALVGALFLTACGGGGGGGAAPTQGAVGVDLPAGWKSKAFGNGRVDYSSPEGDQVTVWPIRIEGEVDGPSVEKMLLAIAGQLHPTMVWGTARSLQPRAVEVSGKDGSRVAKAALTWSHDAGVTAGTIYATLAADARYPDVSQLFVQILTSVRPTGGHSGSMDYVVSNILDTRPSVPVTAFTVERPQDWNVDGGVVSWGTEPQSWITATSPDGHTIAQMRNNFPWYREPDWYYGEGQTFVYGGMPGFTVESPVVTYRSGSNFAAYLLAQEGIQAQTISKREIPELASQLQQQLGLWVGTVHAGEFVYRFQKNGRSYRGGMLSVTLKFYGPMWKLWRLYRFEAPEALAVVGCGVLNRMAESFQIDATWAQVHANIAAADSQAIAKMGEEISRSVNEGYWSRDARFWEAMRKEGNARLGIEDVYDLQLGAIQSVTSGSNYYWIDGQGRIVGTQTATTPGIDFRQLVRLDQ